MVENVGMGVDGHRGVAVWATVGKGPMGPASFSKTAMFCTEPTGCDPGIASSLGSSDTINAPRWHGDHGW